MNRFHLAIALCIAPAAILVACGGGGGNKDKTSTAAASVTKSSTTGTSSPSASKSGTAVANTPAPGTTEAAVATAIANTPGAAETLAANGDTPDAGSTPGPDSTPVPGATNGPDVPAGVPTVSAQDATLAAAAPPETFGGDPNDPPHVVSTVPAPPPGVTPSVDSRTIAPPNPDTSALSVLIDMDASKPGIQSSRDINVGDIIRVGIVVTNAPPFDNNLGGLSGLNFHANYDRTKLVAPTIEGGSSTDRNPDLNTDGLGGDAAQWACLPAAQGDLDDPGSLPGDGNPATGQAFLSCFSPDLGHEGGNIVIATIEFHAIAAGTSQVALSNLHIGDAVGIGFYCDGDLNDPTVPCPASSITVH